MKWVKYMAWPAEQEESWQLFIFSLAESAKGLFLLVYDSQQSYEAILGRLQQEAKQYQWRMVETTLAPGLIGWLEGQIKVEPAKIALVQLFPTVEPTLLNNLNLIRETLHRLPLNLVFIAHQEAYQKLIFSARDLMTWMQIPYHFAHLQSALPQLPSPPITTSESLSQQIEFYQQAIWRLSEEDGQDKLAGLLASLADVYLEAGMFDPAGQLYQWLLDKARATPKPVEQDIFRYEQKQTAIKGWRILAAIQNEQLTPDERNQFVKWLDDGTFSVGQEQGKWFIRDGVGRSQPLSSAVLEKLSLLSGKAATLIKNNRSINSSGITPEILRTLRTTLATSDVFASNATLRRCFVDSRLSPWRNQLPEAGNISGRVDQVIAFLMNKQTIRGENGLVLFLYVLADHVDPMDLLHSQLLNLATQIEGGTVGSPSQATQNRLKRQLQELEAAAQLLDEKIGRLRRAWVIEANPAVKFQLEQQLAEAEADRKKIEDDWARIRASMG